MAFAKELRNNSTKEEKRVWYDCLKKLPYTFNRQKPFGKYIVDFFCSEAKLVIEIDGEQHYSEKGLDYDAERDAYLRSIGLEVLRYSNYEIKIYFDGVFIGISGAIKKRITELADESLSIDGAGDVRTSLPPGGEGGGEADG